MKIITRSEAKAAGLKRYFTGTPCHRGHISEALTSSGTCLECDAENKRNKRSSSANEVRAAARDYSAKNKDRISRHNKTSYTKFAQARIEAQQKWYAANIEAKKAYDRKYRAERRSYRNSLEAMRRAARLKRKPIWFGEFDQLVITEAFDLRIKRCKMTGITWHVDHAIPLRAKTACGLHCGSNIQVIPEKMNITKKNRLIFTNPGEWIRHV